MKKSKILFAGILSVLAFSAYSNVSAYSTVTTELPNEVTRKLGIHFISEEDGKSQIYRNTSLNDNEYLLYCSDYNNTALGNEDVLTKSERMDYGMTYLLKNTYPTKKIITGVTGASSNPTFRVQCASSAEEMINIFITQNAMWSYQNSISYVTNYPLHHTPNGDTDYMCNVWTYDGVTYREVNPDHGEQPNSEFSKLLWRTYVTKIVNEAKAVKDPADATLTVSTDNTWTQENNTYKSNLITVSSSNDEAVLNNYSLSLANAPTGTKVYTEAGNEITSSLSNIPAGTKVYITVPTSEVKNGSSNFSLNATANIKYDAAYQYVDKVNNHQPSVLVGPETKDIAGTLNLTITPDTGSMVSKSIYFIGFIILLSGAGLIYANVKPREQEAE